MPGVRGQWGGSSEYSLPLNNMGLNGPSPLACEFFFSIRETTVLYDLPWVAFADAETRRNVDMEGQLHYIHGFSTA